MSLCPQQIFFICATMERRASKMWCVRFSSMAVARVHDSTRCQGTHCFSASSDALGLLHELAVAVRRGSNDVLRDQWRH